jgi:multidrug efflux pump subunit AcrA (membrane-fusion protein)
MEAVLRKLALFVIVAVLAAGFVFIPQKLLSINAAIPGEPAADGEPGDPEERKQSPVFAVRTAAAERQTLQAYIEVNGNIVNENQVVVMSDVAGKLASMKVSLGSRIQKGALMAEVDPSRPGTAYSLSPVYAPISGTVISNPLAVGSKVFTDRALLTLATAGSVKIEAAIPEREVGRLSTGLRADVFLEAFPGEVFAAEVIRLSPVVDPVSRTKQIILAFIREDSRINPGMFARIKLNIRAYEQVLSIPEDAIVEKREVKAVYVVSPHEQSSGLLAEGNEKEETVRISMRKVVTGVSVDGKIEVKSGLEAGEAVVIQGQQFLSDGAAVRVIESQ